MGRSRLIGQLTASAVLLLLVCGSVMSVAAQGAATQVPVQGNSQFAGRVTRTNPLTINSNGQDRATVLAPNATVLREGKTVAVGDLREGDQVNVTANPDGSVNRIETTAVASEGLPAWLIPLILGLLLLGLLLYFLSRRGKKDNFVLERDTNTPGSTPGTPPRTPTGR